MSQPAVSRHLKVLQDAGLIIRTRRATARLSHLEAAPLRAATSWLAGYREYWEAGYDRLDELLAGLVETGAIVTAAEIIAEPGVPQVIITREFAATPAVLFRAYTEPDCRPAGSGPATTGPQWTAGTSRCGTRPSRAPA